MENTEIRDLVEGDYDQFCKILRKFYDYAGNEKSSEEDLQKLFMKSIDKNRNYVVIGAFEGQSLIGIISMTIGESSYMTSAFCWCDDLYIEENQRGKGIGKKLIYEVKERARGMRCSNILLGVGEDENDTREFYEKIGFEDMKCKLLTLKI